MAIYKRGDTYWYKFMWNGRRIRESAKTGNPKTARQIESARKTELAKGEVGIKDRLPAPTFEEFSERFLTWMNAEHADKESTLRFYRGRVRQLRRYDGFRKALIDQIDKEMVAEFIKWRCQRTRTYALSKKRGTEKLGDTFQPVSIAFVNRDLAALKRMLNIARLWKVISAAPVIKLLPGERAHERVLTHTEESQYLAAAPLLLRQFATIMLDTGMRPEEVCRMRWEHVHLEPLNGARFGFVHNARGKTKFAKRNLSLTARVHSLLSMRHEAAGNPVTGWVCPSNDDPKKHTPYSTIDSQHGRTIERLAETNAVGKFASDCYHALSAIRFKAHCPDAAWGSEYGPLHSTTDSGAFFHSDFAAVRPSNAGTAGRCCCKARNLQSSQGLLRPLT